MLVNKNKSEWTCGKCNRQQKKNRYKSITKQWCKMFICLSCWNRNGPSIFYDKVEVKGKKLVFWQPIKK